LRKVEGKANLETGGAWFRLNSDEAGVFVDDTLNRVQAESETAARSLGGEEGFEDAGSNLRIDAGAVIPDFDERHGTIETSTEPKGSHVVHAFEGVFDQCSPDLIEFATVGADWRQLGIKVELDFDVFQPRVEHDQRVFERLREIYVLNGRLVHVGVVFDGADEVEDANGGVDDRFCKALDAQGARNGCESNGKNLRARDVGQFIE
jgi:hypothetical protein